MQVHTTDFVHASDIFQRFDDREIEIDTFSFGDADHTLVDRYQFAEEVAPQLGVEVKDLVALIPEGAFVDLEG